MHLPAAIFWRLSLAISVISVPNAAHTIQKFDVNTSITHSWTIINGFAGEFSPEVLDNLLVHPDVEYISEAGIGNVTAIQTDAPWGLARLTSRAKLTKPDFAVDFTYNPTATGRGVDVYVIDTGVRTSHTQFNGRAVWGKTFGRYPDIDDNGHGTHCAGTVAGSRWGVAKEASIIAVKTFSGAGRGTAVDTIDGLNFVAQSTAASRHPSIASMSFEFSAIHALDDAVQSIIMKGIHAVIAAGNSNIDAANTSPARVVDAITVAASTIGDVKASFSNFGSVVDVFAPGQTIITASATNDVDARYDSGTSMATPHISGLIAYLISRDGNASPAVMATKLKTLGLLGVVSGVPAGTVNLLAHIA